MSKRNLKLRIGLVVATVVAVFCVMTLIESTRASDPVLKGGIGTTSAAHAVRGLAAAPMAAPETVPFQGTYTDAPAPPACGTRHNFTVPAGKLRIVVAASANIPANDIVLKFYGAGWWSRIRAAR